jgi:hypothetical protein
LLVEDTNGLEGDCVSAGGGGDGVGKLVDRWISSVGVVEVNSGLSGLMDSDDLECVGSPFLFCLAIFGFFLR